jgi:hypothetical protein
MTVAPLLRNLHGKRYHIVTFARPHEDAADSARSATLVHLTREVMQRVRVSKLGCMCLIDGRADGGFTGMLRREGRRNRRSEVGTRGNSRA